MMSAFISRPQCSHVAIDTPVQRTNRAEDCAAGVLPSLSGGASATYAPMCLMVLRSGRRRWSSTVPGNSHWFVPELRHDKIEERESLELRRAHVQSDSHGINDIFWATSCVVWIDERTVGLGLHRDRFNSRAPVRSQMRNGRLDRYPALVRLTRARIVGSRAGGDQHRKDDHNCPSHDPDLPRRSCCAGSCRSGAGSLS